MFNLCRQIKVSNLCLTIKFNLRKRKMNSSNTFNSFICNIRCSSCNNKVNSNSNRLISRILIRVQTTTPINRFHNNNSCRNRTKINNSTDKANSSNSNRLTIPNSKTSTKNILTIKESNIRAAMRSRSKTRRSSRLPEESSAAKVQT